MESWRVGDTIAETLCEAAGDLCTAIVALRAETGANESADEDPVARLDRLRPDWRNSLPFAIEVRDVRTLVEKMVRVRATSAYGLGLSLRVVKVDGLWKRTALVDLRGALTISNFPPTVETHAPPAGGPRQ